MSSITCLFCCTATEEGLQFVVVGCYLSARLQDTMSSSSTGSTIKKRIYNVTTAEITGAFYFFIFSLCSSDKKKGILDKNTDPISFSVV